MQVNRAPIALLCLTLSSCGGVLTGSVSAFDLRTAVVVDEWQSFSTEQQTALRTGKVSRGMPEVALYLAYGRPLFHWQTTIEGASCRALLYPDSAKSAVERVAYSCSGTVALVDEIESAIPCWRIDDVAPRILEAEDYFSGLRLARQWELVIGLIKRGHSSRDVKIGFGAPYNTGREVREDGVEASTQVFLDRGGDSYGFYVTLVDGRVRGWRIPADRKLTPEAQKRRMEAMEQRLMDKLREMDEAAERRHAETVDHLNTIQENQEEIRADIAAQTEQVAAAAMTGGLIGGAAGSRSGGGSGGGGDSDDNGDAPAPDSGGDAEGVDETAPEPTPPPKPRVCKKKGVDYTHPCRKACREEAHDCGSDVFNCFKANCNNPNREAHQRCEKSCVKSGRKCELRAKRKLRSCERKCRECVD